MELGRGRGARGAGTAERRAEIRALVAENARSEYAEERGARPESTLERALPAGPPRDQPRDPEARTYYLTAELSARLFYRDRSSQRYDPWSYFTHKPGLDIEVPWPEHPEGHWRYATNSLGLREDGELLEGRPDLGILVTGNSHTDGFCSRDRVLVGLPPRSRLSTSKTSTVTDAVPERTVGAKRRRGR